MPLGGDALPRFAALVVALACFGLPALLRQRTGRRALQALAPALGALLSALYVVHYLRGGPRIIDATAYWLEGSLLAEGRWGLPLDGPEQATLGRFLLRTPGGEATVIFPPGYPAVLALGFLLEAPLAIGPALAAALTYATMDLGRQILARRGGTTAAEREQLVTVLGLVSAGCAALRYHTADTMSHGLCALLVVAVLAAALRLRNAPRAPLASLLVGLGLGWLFATRPVSALALGPAVVLVVGQPTLRAATLIALGLVPGIALWLGYQHQATGELWGVAQRSYYAVSDGPPGCFRYGFGEGIGCLGEHGDFVRHNLRDGYGAFEALATTARRLKMHVSDPLGFAPSILAVGLGMVDLLRRPGLRGIAALPLFIIAAYAPFYFDGNYPGGGARLLSDAIGVEQALAVLGCRGLAEHLAARRRAQVTATHLATAVLALSFVGFATYLEPDHAQLRDREGGRPMFDPSRAPPSSDLLFVTTDHGFLLARASRRRVARFKGDGFDRLVWEHHGRPRAWLYRHHFDGAEPDLERLRFAAAAPSELRIEGESLWPPRDQQDGWAWPSYLSAPCASGGRALTLWPAGGKAAARVTLSLPDELAGQRIVPRILHLGDTGGRLGELRLVVGETTVGRRTMGGGNEGRCERIEPLHLPATGGPASLEIESAEPVALDLVRASRKR